MKTFLFVNDYSPEADCVYPWVESFAERAGAKLLIWSDRKIPEKVLIGARNKRFTDVLSRAGNSIFSTSTLTDCINKHQIDCVLIGTSGDKSESEMLCRTFFFRNHCPLMLVPIQAAKIVPDHLVYLTDLRFTRNEVIYGLQRLTGRTADKLTLAHSCTPGLPDMTAEYAQSAFNERMNQLGTGTFMFCHVTDGRAGRAADVFVHILEAGMLAMAYGQPHYHALDATTLAEVPVLLYPS